MCAKPNKRGCFRKAVTMGHFLNGHLIVGGDQFHPIASTQSAQHASKHMLGCEAWPSPPGGRGSASKRRGEADARMMRMAKRRSSVKGWTGAACSECRSVHHPIFFFPFFPSISIDIDVFRHVSHISLRWRHEVSVKLFSGGLRSLSCSQRSRWRRPLPPESSKVKHSHFLAAGVRDPSSHPACIMHWPIVP